MPVLPTHCIHLRHYLQGSKTNRLARLCAEKRLFIFDLCTTMRHQPRTRLCAPLPGKRTTLCSSSLHHGCGERHMQCAEKPALDTQKLCGESSRR